MARIAKTGLNYIPIDVDIFDDPKLLKIEDQFGVKGGYIAMRLLFWIYRDGYYTTWKEDTPLIFAKRVGNGITGALVNEVVGGLLKCSFFSEEMFKSFSILTSRGIQNRWLKIIVDSNRTSEIIPEYNLINGTTNTAKSDNFAIQSDLIPIQSDLIAEKSEDMQQRKGKETKGKEKKENQSPKKLEISQEAKDYSIYFQSLLTSNQKVTETDLYNWGKTFDDLVRIDKRLPDEIYKITKWARDDEFWKSNFMSACKLRQKNKDGVLYYDVFFQKSKLNRNSSNGKAETKLRKPNWF